MSEVIVPMVSQSVIPSQKHKQQGPVIEAREFKLAHDRFLIIDDAIYHVGASLKDLGKKWCAFSKMEMQTVEMLARVGI